MVQRTQQYGPRFLRYELIQLDALCSEGKSTGWRDAEQHRVEALTAIFLGGSFGLGVACGVQIIEKEDPPGQKLIDDGVSTVAALKMCAKEYEQNAEATPSGDVWSESLVSVFQRGLNVKVVAYENDDRESREAWNTAKHDEERNDVRWSTLYQEVATAYLGMMRSESRDWKHVATRVLDLYGPGGRCVVDRWIRAAHGLSLIHI